MRIRDAIPQDRDAIERVYRSAFPPDEWEPAAELAVALLDEVTTPATVNLVAEDDERVVGHVAFSPVFDAGDQAHLGTLLAPLAVDAGCQRRGVGTALVRHGIDQLTAAGTNVVLVYGDPAYYGRFGFTPEAGADYLPPYPLEFPFGWQALTQTRPDQPVRFDVVKPLDQKSLW
jgi:putative acetyltransferase